jgi:hypothetical protein
MSNFSSRVVWNAEAALYADRRISRSDAYIALNEKHNLLQAGTGGD